MELTREQQAILDGEQGEVMAKIMKTVVMYGDTFGATKLVPITSEYGHIVSSFGVSVITGVFDMMDELVEAGITSKQKFTADPRPVDPAVPANLIQKIVFKVMYGPQERYEKQLEAVGLRADSCNAAGTSTASVAPGAAGGASTYDDAFSCACYLGKDANVPKRGDILSWAESSAVSYANSVLGARCNRNSGIIEMFGSILGYVPYFGLLTDEGRKAKWVVEVKTSKLPEAQLLGSAIGMKVVEDVPYVKGLSGYFNGELSEEACTYLKDFGAAAASNGSVGLYHIEGLTPETKDFGEDLVASDAQVYVIDDAEIQRVKNGYPVIWKKPDAKPKLAFIGCPHMTLAQLQKWTLEVETALAANNLSKVKIPTIFTAPPAIIKEFGEENKAKLASMGIVLSYICPLMYMANPACADMPVITNSNKLRTYTSARYYTDAEILVQIAGGY